MISQPRGTASNLLWHRWSIHDATVAFALRLTPLSRRLSQWICGVHGHDTQLQIGADRLLLRCTHCGYASPGWVVGRPARDEPELDAPA